MTQGGLKLMEIWAEKPLEPHCCEMVTIFGNRVFWAWTHSFKKTTILK